MKIRVAHSPDADDIFMYYAVKFGWVDIKDYMFENLALDIETLNIEAMKGEFEVTAISFGVYPFIKDDYALLRCAISFGNGYGPKLVKKRGIKLKDNFKVALSGKHTTNAMIFRLQYPNARIFYMNFLDIEDAVIRGEVDAGVLIHESILNFDEVLEVEAEIWDIWLDLIKDNLPLPLGGMAIRRSIPLNRAIEIEEILTQAVKVANNRKNELTQKLQNDSLLRVSDDLLSKYLNMYASEESVELSQIQIRALNALYKIGFERGFYSEPIDVEDYLIPKEYKKIRDR